MERTHQILALDDSTLCQVCPQMGTVRIDGAQPTGSTAPHDALARSDNHTDGFSVIEVTRFAHMNPIM
jgi:hypothetical protein